MNIHFHPHLSLPEKDDVLDRLDVVKQHLPLATQKQAYTQILLHLDVESRLGASLPALELAKLCQTQDAVDIVEELMGVPEVDCPAYLPALYNLLRRFSHEEWQQVREAVGDEYQAVIQISKDFLLSEEQQNSEQILLLLATLKQHINNEHLEGLAPLIQLCQDGEAIAAIIHRLLLLPDDLREDIVEGINNAIHAPLSSRDLLMRLQVAHMVALMHGGEVLVVGPFVAQPPPDFLVSREEFIKYPEQVLANLVDFLDAANPSPNSIGFIDSETRGPGVAKEFLSELLVGVCQKIGLDKVDDGRYRLEKPEHFEVYFNIGKLFSYCIEQDLVVGSLFDPGLFVGIMNLCEQHNTHEISVETIDIFFPLYKLMKGYFEDDKASVALMEKTLGDQYTKDVLVECMPKLISPCMAVKMGLEIPQDITTGEELEAAIQGRVSADAILSQISWGRGVTHANRAQIEAWIKNLDADRQKLLAFLSVVTGSPGLGINQIVIEISGISIQTHTCVQQLSLPSDISIEDALHELDKALARKDYFNTI